MNPRQGSSLFGATVPLDGRLVLSLVSVVKGFVLSRDLTLDCSA